MHLGTFKKSIAVFVVVFLLSNLGVVITYAAFPDVPAQHPQKVPIDFFTNLEVIQGYADGYFRPDKNVARAEATKIIFLATQNHFTPPSRCYTDVRADHWFSRYVCWSDFIQGYGDGSFQPGRTINFGEALKMMYVAFTGTFPEHTSVLGPWYKETIQDAKNLGFIAASISGRETVSRAAFMDMMYRFYAQYKDQTIPSLPEPNIAPELEVAVEQPPESAAEPPSGGFVYADGTKFMLNGKEFKFMGVNVYGAANSQIYSCGPYGYGEGGINPEAFLRSLFSHLKENNMTVMRFWAFQAFTDNGTDYSAFDRIFSLANEYGIKVIPTLENQWDHCPDNIGKGANWYRSGYKSPYGNYSLSFPDYVRRTVTRYKNEPAILMWQFMNEAESEDAEALLHFTRDIAEIIKGIDTSHLVNLGTMATGQPGTANEHLINLHRLVDVLEIHDYNKDEEAWPTGHNSVSRAASVAIELNIPFFIGETGIKADSDTTNEERALLFENKFREFFDHGGSGYLIWRWSNDVYDEFCRNGHCVTVGDPVLEVIKRYPPGN